MIFGIVRPSVSRCPKVYLKTTLDIFRGKFLLSCYYSFYQKVVSLTLDTIITINAFHLIDEDLNVLLDAIITLLQSGIFCIDIIDTFFLYARCSDRKIAVFPSSRRPDV